MAGVGRMNKFLRNSGKRQGTTKRKVNAMAGSREERLRIHLTLLKADSREIGVV